MAAAALLASTSPLLAQTPAPTAPRAPPTRQELERLVRPDAARPPSRLTVEGELERTPCSLDRPEYAAIRFTLTGAEFAGLRGLEEDDLRAAYSDLVGREQPLSVVCEIRDRAAALLRAAGYIAAVEVPEQRIEGGLVRFRVVMARIVDIRVRGDAGRNERLIASYLRRLLNRPAFNRFEAERALLLADDLPGYNVRLALRPSGGPAGDVVGDVSVVRLPGQLDFNVQNYAADATGPWGALLRGQLFGVTGLGDRTVAAVYATADVREQTTVQFAHDFTIGDNGLRLGGQLTYAWARPETGNPAINLASDTLFATLEAGLPLVRRQTHSIRIGLGLDFVDQDVRFNGLPLARDHLRVLFARLGLEALDPRAARFGPRRERAHWRLQGGLELRQGLDILGASLRCDAFFANCTAPGRVPPGRLEGNPTATVLRANLGGEWRPTADIGLFIGATGQYADTPLFAFEEFSAGNYTVGRGYEPATLVGDRGAGVQAELRLGRLAPRTPESVAVQPYLFFDAAWVENEDRLFVMGGSESLQSTGAGVRALWGDRAQLDLTLAVPLARVGPLNDRPDPRLLLSITTRLLPWRTR